MVTKQKELTPANGISPKYSTAQKVLRILIKWIGMAQEAKGFPKPNF